MSNGGLGPAWNVLGHGGEMNRMAMNRSLGSLALALLLAVSGSAAADAQGEAKKHSKRGVELMKEQQFEEATIEFKRAHELHPELKYLYNLGQAYAAVGNRPVEAFDWLARYLEEGGNKVPAARRAEVQEEIARQRARIATITVRVVPDGASVRLDGKQDLGKAPLASPVRVALGTHQINVSLDGYQAEQVTVEVAGEEKKAVEIALKPVAKAVEAAAARNGQVSVECGVPDVAVSVDGTVVGKTPLREALLVPVGTRAFTFERAGYVADKRAVDLTEAAVARVDCGVRAVSPLSAALAGRLELRVSEPGAETFVDGAAYATGSAIPSGLHHVQVKRSGFQAWARDVTVRAGGATGVDATLVPTPGYLYDYVSSAKSRRTWAYVLGLSGVAIGGAAVGVYAWNNGRYGTWTGERDALDLAYAQKPPYPPGLDQRQASNDELIQSIQSYDKVTVGLGITGGALLATGVALLVTGDDPAKYEKLVVAPQSGGGGMGVGWTW
jgi:hypothetical protein